MKRKFLALILTIVSVFTVFAIANKDAKEADALSVSAGTKIYFEKPSDWKAAHLQFMVGHNNWSEGYTMTNISGTNLYYISMIQWDNASKFAIVNTNEAKWGGEGGSIDNRLNWVLAKTPTYSSSISGTCFFYINGSKLNMDTILNYDITASCNEGGAATVSGKSLSGNTLSTSNKAIARTTTATLTATATEGYKFVGWYSDAQYATLLTTDATYITPAVTAAKTYYAKFEKEAIDTTPLKSLFTEYNKDVYIRDTQIYADLTKIEADFDNSTLVDSLGDLFHNPGIDNQNVILKRTTTFCGSYLYFDNGVAFGSNKDNLTSFTWTEEYENTTTGEAVNNHFITLKDFAELNAVDKNGEVSLEKGWSVDADGVYTSTDENVIKAALAFTAPGWVMIDDKYIDFTQVTVFADDAGLHIRLWVSSGNSGLLVDDAEVSGNNLLFSQAVISK